MATSNLKYTKKKKKQKKKTSRHCVTLIRHCDIFEKVKDSLSVSYNNENKLKVTFQFPLAKGTFN